MATRLSRLRNGFTRRHGAALLVLATIAANVYLDYRLFLRNPRELEAQAKRFLRAALPGHTAKFGGETQFNLFTGRLTLTKVTFHRQGNEADVLFEVPELTVESDGLIPTKLSIRALGPTAHLQITKDGKIRGLDLSSDEPTEPVTSLPLDLEIEVEGGVVTIENDFEGMGAEVLVSRLETVPGRRIQVRKDLSCEGALSLYLASMIPKGARSPPQDVPGLPENRQAEPVIRKLTVELSRTSGGPLAVVAHGRAIVSPAVRRLIPPVFQTEVWDEIGPLRGEGDVMVRLTQAADQINVDLSLTPRQCAMKSKGFPVEIVEIEGGRFEISIAIDKGDLRFLGVAWEGCQAKIRGPVPGDPGLGRLVSRGAVFPGYGRENVTMHITVQAYDLPLAPHLVDAIPFKIREVYDLFDPQGVVPEAHVQIFKGPEDRDTLVLADGREVRGLLDARAKLELDPYGEWVPSTVQPLSKGLDAAIRFVDYQRREHLVPIREVARIKRNREPQISVWVPRIDGKLSACFREVPERLEGIRGWFELREGGNVEVYTEGRLEHGGTAKVRAQVMHGDLISVNVKARQVPVGPHIAQIMPGESKVMIEPFRLQGGEMDVDVTLSKPHADAPAQPVIKAKLRGVGFDHREASIPLQATGDLEVRPIFLRSQEDGPDRIDIALDLALEGEGVVAAVASGTLQLPPKQPASGIEFKAALRAKIGELKVGVIPPLIKDLLDPVRPEGVARDLDVFVESPEALWVQGRGAGLRMQPRAFDVPLEVESFHVEVAEGRVLLHETRARRVATSGSNAGRLGVSGWIALEGEATPPPLQLALDLTQVPLDEALVGALPEETRAALEQLEPSGLISGQLRVGLRPERPADVRGRLEVSGARLTLHRLTEQLKQLEEAPLSELRGVIELSPERIGLSEMRAKIAGGELSLDAGELRFSEGELSGFDLPARLTGLRIEDRTRRLAGEGAREFFKTFYVEGPADLDLHTFKESKADEVHVFLEARPKGALVRADFAPVPVTGLTGRARIEDGEPVLLDLRGFLSPPTLTGGTAPADPDAARVRIQRDASREDRFPGEGGAGRVYRVSVTDFRRYPLVEGPDRPNSLRERFEARLQPSWRETLDDFDLAGTFDVESWFYQPDDPRDAMRWVAEARFREAALTLATFEDAAPRPGERAPGIGFTELAGTLRLKGRLAELEQGSCRGELYLSRADFFKQTFSDLSGPLQIQKGKLSLGVPGQPFRARLYEGDFLGRCDFDFQSGAYACEFALGLGRDQRRGRLAAVMRELGELSDDTKKDEGKAPFAYRGGLSARISCGGGGKDLAGRARPFRGAGEVRLEDSNLLDTPFLKALQIVIAKIRGSSSNEPLPNLAIDFRMNETGLRIRSADIWGRDLKVHGEDGLLRYDGYIDIDVVPFNTTGGLHQILKWVPGTGYSYKGSFADDDGPQITAYLNPLSTIDWFRNLWQGEKE